MIEQQGLVTATGQGTARVRLGGTSGCPACDAGRGCGAGIFGRLVRRRPVEMELDDPLGVRVGQAVVVGVPETLFLRATWLAYGWPLLALLVGAAAGHRLGQALAIDVDLAALTGASALMAGAWLLNRRRANPTFETHALALLRRADGDAGPCPGGRAVSASTRMRP